MIQYTSTSTYRSPLGLIVIESDGEALTGLRFADVKASASKMEHDEAGGEKVESNKVSSAIPIIAATIRLLDDYFSGKRTENATMGKQPENVTIGKQTENSTMGKQTDTLIVVKPRGTMFQQRVWQALLTIPYGETVSYGEIARMVGCRSAQAVGQAVGANPIAILIPCHRVIAANGKIGGYAYGEEKKKRLLACEQQSKHKKHQVGKANGNFLSNCF
ncbi:MAG: methylated-DNA--[Paludibacteraceae bacterium]|nr:methylated-DNA--[protein]-cysteine S-methyltransferase [Paludibacteraceae bacterium]